MACSPSKTRPDMESSPRAVHIRVGAGTKMCFASTWLAGVNTAGFGAVTTTCVTA